jgi:hypothetical protein
MSDSETESMRCRILYVEQDEHPLWHNFTCLNLETNEQVEVTTKYEYFAEYFRKSNDGINISYWDYAGFRQVINRLIKFDTELFWNDYTDGHNGPQLVNNNDEFVKWLNRHNELNGGFGFSEFDSDEEFPDKRN